MRVDDLAAAAEGRGLVSEILLEWNMRMMATVKNEREAREELLAWSQSEGVAAVMDYVMKKLEAMGPPLLERAAVAEDVRGGERGVWELMAELQGDDGVLIENDMVGDEDQRNEEQEEGKIGMDKKIVQQT